MNDRKKIILAFDSFKGSAASQQIAESASGAILEYIPDCEIVTVPIADGGEGTTVAICSNIDTVKVECNVTDPLKNKIKVDYNITADGKVAIMEMAAASGLPLVPADKRNPRIATSFGTGEMIKDAVQRGCRKILLGIGGSATNDAGVGMLAALGFRFLDEKGNETFDLQQIESFDCSGVVKELKNVKFDVICDVTNPFYGENGAACVFAPQKGASPEDVEYLDKGLKHFAEVVKRDSGIDLQTVSGSGAAGGMGGGLYAFLNAELMPGIDAVLNMLNFDAALDGASLVLTGEGKIDRQTAEMGKALAGILERAKKVDVPVAVIAGAVENVDELNRLGFTAVLSIQSKPVSLDEAMKTEVTLENVRKTVSQIVRLMF